MKLMILAIVALIATLVVVACGGIAFTAANAPAMFGEFNRRADVAYGTRARQRLDVYAPWHAASKPIIVFWYGGGWENGRKSQYRFVGAALAKAGYVAVLPDYRLFPEVKFPAFVEDGAEALAWVVSHAAEIGGDPKRIYLAGHSAGAHLAAMLAYDSSRLERVGLARDTVRGYIGLSGPYALDPDNDTYRAIFAAPFGLADWQPVQLAKRGAPPALLLHGEADDVVGVSHARRMAAQLEALGVEVTLRVYPGRGHRDTVAAFAMPAPHKLPVMEEIRRFVK
ncbi:MAG TPA: alpha/beta hydrolase [Steroidobacteraceae bacterium]|jgi:acetyl esterase/lipase|nr:alpha/beta hydrolase [Steroidobacteraceae bacterium]